MTSAHEGRSLSEERRKNGTHLDLPIMVMFSLVLSGCAADDSLRREELRLTDQSVVNPSHTMDKTQKVASASAAEALARQRINADRRYAGKQYKMKTIVGTDGWHIYVTFLPPTPGSDLSVNVRKDGNVTVVGLW